MPMSRLPPLDPATLDADQRVVYDRMKSGTRGNVGGPFIPLLTSPELCGRVEQLGLFLRFQCGVPMRLRELAICVVGTHWKAAYEVFVHAPIARKQGVPDSVISAVTHEVELPADADAADRTVVAFAREVLRTGKASDATYDAARALLGDKGVVELTGLLGYYGLLALQLNVFQVIPPDTSETPWLR
jgi:4-carboxymuconolactone decarboxylase